MYEAFFNLKKKPFELIPDPDFIYLSRSHKKALTYLDYGIRERAGFILLTGEVGSGKTTIIRDLLSKKYDKVVLAKIFNTRVSSEQLISMINDDFGLPVAGKDKISLIRDLNDFLLEQYAVGAHPILIIDEAQNLAADLLEEVRMLSNLESSHGKLLQIMLVGQPELRETLAAPELLQLRQRISINCHLKALSHEETHEYIQHRMEVAGNLHALDFSEQTIEIIHGYSHGIPRLINIICDFIMLSAFAEEVRTVTLDMVRDILGDLDFENHYWGGHVAELPVAGNPTDLPRAYPLQDEQPLMRELAQRVASVEKEFSNRVPAALKDVCDSLVLLKDELSSRLGRCETQVNELNEKLVANEKLAAVEHLTEVVVETEKAVPAPAPVAIKKGGFVRRLFGGTDSTGW